VAESKTEKVLRGERRKSDQVEPDPLTTAKRRLLRRSDWMGLSAARPLHMQFPSVEELENVGKRRKVTLEDRKRQEGVQAPVNHSTSKHNHNARPSRHRIIDRRTEEPSIRMGSNIHQSQTTPMPSQTRKPMTPICQSESSESMLLDKEFVASQQSITRNRPNHISKSSRMESKRLAETFTRNALVSLEEFRDSKNFDEVKAKSGSIGEQQLPRRPGKPDENLKRRAANRNTTSDQARSSSVVVGRRLLTSTPSPSSFGRLETSAQVVGSTATMPQAQLPRQVPDSLSSDFLPPGYRRASSPGVLVTIASERAQRLPINSVLQACENTNSRPPPSSNHGKPQSRPPFTLEIQAEAEADAQTAENLNPPTPRGVRVQATPLGTSPKPRNARDLEVVEFNGETRETQSRSQARHFSPSIADDYHAQKPKDIRSRLRRSQLVRDSILEDVNIGIYPRLGDPSNVLQSGAGHHYSAQDQKPPQRSSMQRRLRSPRQATVGIDADRRLATIKSDENQAWMRFVLEDDFSPPRTTLCTEHPKFAATNPRTGRPRWLRQRQSDELTLPEEFESQTQSGGWFSPAHSIMTAANTTIYNRSVAEEAQQSETDFLSQLSPMEGRLDERLLNPSLYTNPARTERSYIRAPSLNQGHHEIESLGEDVEAPAAAAFKSPAVHPLHDFSEGHGQSSYSPIVRRSSSKNATIERSSHRTPLKAIPNLFVNPRRAPKFRRNYPPNFLKPSRSPSSNMPQADADVESSISQWIEPPSSAGNMPITVRRPKNTFPMNYSPIRHTQRKTRVSQSTVQRPLTSHSVASRTGFAQTRPRSQADHNGMQGRQDTNPVRASRTFSPSYIPPGIPSRQAQLDLRTPNYHHNPLPNVAAIHSPIYSTNPHSTPPPPSSAQLYDLAFKKPPPTFSAQRRPRPQPEPFSTPRPVKSLLGGLSTPGRPFSAAPWLVR
jgi:hypothetical protein